MVSEGNPDRNTLSTMKLSELRQLCSDRGLLVSGKKHDLVDRLLGLEAPSEEVPETVTTRISEDMDDAIDKLIARVSGDEPAEPAEESEPEHDASSWLESPEEESEPEPEPEEEIIEAEIIEAELAETEETEPEEEPEPVEEDPWFSGVIPSEATDELLLDDEEEEPSMVIMLPSAEVLKDNWQAFSAITVVVLLVGAIAFYLVQQDPAFTARPLRYGDYMDFTVTETTIEITGDEMIGILRDVTSPTLDEVCDELRATVTGGTGSISIRNGGIGDISHPLDAELIGAVNVHDAYGREHLTAEQTVMHDLAIDLQGKVRDEGTCTNTGWIKEDNSLISNSKSWREITGKKTIRTDTDLSFTDPDNVRTDARAVSFGSDGYGSLGSLSPLLIFPLTPIELHEFFGDTPLTDGLSSVKTSGLMDWTWTVRGEINTQMHGLVTHVSISEDGLAGCVGHVNIDIHVKRGNPWPVKQMVDILLDKDGGDDCSLQGLISDYLLDLPDGTLTVSAVITETSSNFGSTPVHWDTAYAGSPGSGEDIPSSQQHWEEAMPDESDIREFDLEAAVDCLMTNHSSSDAAEALESAGYIWQATYSTDEWNMSWVDDNENAGWVVLRHKDSGCILADEHDYDEDTVSWDRNEIPETLTLGLMEERILSESRYPELNQFISNGTGWGPSMSYGYLLATASVDILSLNIVTAAGMRSWEESGRDNTASFAIDAESGRMVGWYHTSLPAD